MRKINREGKYGPRRRRKNRQIFGPQWGRRTEEENQRREILAAWGR